MSDGTEALDGTQEAQPPMEASEQAVEQVEGAADDPQPSQGEVAVPSYLDDKLREALGKLPEDQREAFLRLGDSLPDAREIILKGVDYHAKRQKESKELRELREALDQAKQDATYWQQAQADPMRAAQLFAAAAGQQLPNAQEAPKEQPPEVTLDDVLMEADPDKMRELRQQYEAGLERRMLQKVEGMLQNTPQAKDTALRQKFQQLRQSADLSDQQWNTVLSAADAELQARGVRHTDLDPTALELVLAPMIRLVRSQTTQSADLNPNVFSGSQATSLRSAGTSSSRPAVKRPSADAPIEERLAWTLKSQGLRELE